MAGHFVLTGGIGSGKSTAARHFSTWGAAVISADEAGHAVLAPGGEAAGAVAERWPDAVVEGAVDRSALAAIVFADDAELSALEAITHPAIVVRIAEAVAASTAEVVMVESPVDAVTGAGWPKVVVDAPDHIRIARLEGRGMAPHDIVARMASQPTRAEWLTIADLVVDNSGSLEDLAIECARVWDWITSSLHSR